MEEKFIKWFIKEIPVLVEKGIITSQTAHSLNEYYYKKLEDLEQPQKAQTQPQSTVQSEQKLEPAFTELTQVNIPQKEIPPASAINSGKDSVCPEKSEPVTKTKKTQKVSVSVILSVIAGILISTGIISLIAYNWAAIPRLAKAITAILLLLASQSVGIILVKTGKAEEVKIRESYSIFWALLFGGIVAFVSQIFKFAGNTSSFLFVWAASSIIITYLFKAHTSYFLSLVLTICFCFSGIGSNFYFLYFILFTALYFPARKVKIKFIPLFIFVGIFFLFFLDEILTTGNIKNMIFMLILCSAGFILLQKNIIWKKYFGICLAGLSALGSIYLWKPYSSFTNPTMSAGKVTNIVLAALITLGFVSEAILIPVIKKIKARQLLSLDNLIYLIPFVIALNPLFINQTKIITAQVTSAWYKMFLSPLLFTILFTELLFVTTSIKKSKTSWIFLGFLMLEALKVTSEKNFTFTLFFTVAAIFVFALGTLLWKNAYGNNEENKYCLIAARALSAAMLFIIAFAVRFADYDKNIFTLSKTPHLILFCYIPAAVFGCFLLALFAKKNLKAFLSHLDILVNLIFALVIFAASRESNYSQICLLVNIWIALNFIYSVISAIKAEKYTLLIYSALALIYFLSSYFYLESRITLMFFSTSLLLFVSGLILWKTSFALTPFSKNALIIVRILAVIILFITNLLARNEVSLLYNNSGIDLFMLICFAPTALFGLLLFCRFAKVSIKDFLLNIDIIANLLVTTIVLCFAHAADKDVILMTLQIITAINLLISCVYIIRSGRYEYAFYTLFAVIYLIVVFTSLEFSSTILYLISCSVLFISGTYLWKNNFELNANNKTVLLVSKIAGLVLLLGTAIFTLDESPVLFETAGITNYILICFTPAAVFGLVLYGFFAFKNLRSFLCNLDIIINLIFVSVLYLIAHLCTPAALLLSMEIMLLLNLAAALAFVFLLGEKESAVYFISGILYYFIKMAFTDNTNSSANILLVLALISLFLHYYAQSRNVNAVKIISMIISGIILFYETSLRCMNEGDFSPISWNLYSVAFLILAGLTALYFIAILIRKKTLFNPAIFLTPAVVILLTKLEDKNSILVTLPVVLIFCVYYFYLAYKNDSLKTANLSTIYFGLTLMIRFFSAGYGLAIQGITFIVMGILLLVMNVLMTKRREKNE